MTATVLYEHLYLVFMSVLFSILVGLPLGVLAYLVKPIRTPLLKIIEILQTVPSLAMLGIIMVLMGAGKTTVIIGVVLNSLLPIVSNTVLGLENVNEGVKEAARGMGLSRLDQLLTVEFPLAFPMVFAGVRIAAVTAVGIAVFATSVGGGGLGSVINRGIRTQNFSLIASGTVALMGMAMGFDVILAWVERRLERKTA